MSEREDEIVKRALKEAAQYHRKAERAMADAEIYINSHEGGGYRNVDKIDWLLIVSSRCRRRTLRSRRSVSRSSA